MDKQTPILIIGFGSIGKRHYRNLKQLGFNQVTVFDSKDKAFAEIPKVKRLAEVTLSSLKNFKVAFICTPTHLHLKYALLVAEAGCHLFIEKPLSHDFKRVDQLIKICRTKKLVNMVACNFRFNQGFQFLKKIVKGNELGQPLSTRVVIGHDLSQSRSGVDYRKTYAAAPRGGGVILDSGAHAIDYLVDLFGEAKKINGFLGNISELEIKSEDFAEIIINHKTGVITSLSLDYFSRPKRHSVEIQFEQGWAKWDFVKNEITVYHQSTKQLERVVLYEGMSEDDKRNVMYLEELASFIKLIAKEKVEVTQGLVQAKRTLTTLTKIKNQAIKL